jgi:hypothetical protein
MTLKASLAGAVIFFSAPAHVWSSGPIGIYAIVEKVVLEPSEASPERIQVWGAFSYVEGAMPDRTLVITGAERGYLYFKLPASVSNETSESDAATIRNEWRDLKAVAGTGQAIGFGRWPGGVRQSPPSVILPRELRGTEADYRVRPATEKPGSPAPYLTNSGIVKLSDHAGHERIIKHLRDALKR